jgi:hypothetical protein
MLLSNLTLFVILSVVAMALTLFKDYRFETSEWFAPALVSSVVVAATVLFVDAGKSRVAVALAFALSLLWLRSRRADADVVEGLLTGSVL